MVDYKEMVRTAREAFKNHKLASIFEDRWTLAKEGTSDLWVQVVSLKGGSILVHGDFEPCIFGTFSGRDSMAKVAWVARMIDSPSYAWEKASIGMMDGDITSSFDFDTAVRGLKNRVQELKEESGDEDFLILVEDLEHEVENLRPYDDMRVIDDLLGMLAEEHSSSYYGTHISYRVVMAVAAVERLYSLLKDNGGKNESK